MLIRIYGGERVSGSTWKTVARTGGLRPAELDERVVLAGDLELSIKHCRWSGNRASNTCTSRCRFAKTTFLSRR